MQPLYTRGMLLDALDILTFLWICLSSWRFYLCASISCAFAALLHQWVLVGKHQEAICVLVALAGVVYGFFWQHRADEEGKLL